MEHSAKILLLGKTGVGKSSFINYFLGKTVAKARAGKPVTMDYFIPYEIKDGRYPIKIFDTKGLEAIGAYNQLNEIINGIKQQNSSDNIFDWFHTIFYCVSMANPRFEDFEANFVHKLQQELTQHIHIIITQCDAASPEKIATMRHTIAEKLGNMENVEIFEVVSISMTKRNGQVVEPRGKEEISERVFDLLLKDIAHKLSSDYAKTLRDSLIGSIDRMRWDLNDFFDETITAKTLFRLIKNSDKTMDRIDARMDEVLGQVENNLESIQQRTDEKLTEILRPVAQLYNSYWGITTNSYVEGAELDFPDVFEGMDTDWLDKITERDFMTNVLPKLGRYINEDGELPGNSSIAEILKMVGAGVGDLFRLKKNLKDALWKLCWNPFYKSIPSQEEIQAKAYERIVNYIKPDLIPIRDISKGLKEIFGELQETTNELIEDWTALRQTAAANNGKIPDVNEILRQVLEARQQDPTESAEDNEDRIAGPEEAIDFSDLFEIDLDDDEF